MDVTAANKIAAMIVANFDKRSNRPLLLSFAIFIAEQENGTRTSDVVNEFYDVKNCDPIAYSDRLSTLNRQLLSMEKVGILSKKLEGSFVPKFSSKSKGVGLGKFIKNNAARWRMKIDLTQ